MLQKSKDLKTKMEEEKRIKLMKGCRKWTKGDEIEMKLNKTKDRLSKAKSQCNTTHNEQINHVKRKLIIPKSNNNTIHHKQAQAFEAVVAKELKKTSPPITCNYNSTKAKSSKACSIDPDPCNP
ncbi:hypothetical protein TetV_079 [Tetraselmis virus 1]|uniref:Uncharacterized protein n=1 Tax=Tetraselmis virus 1 TaxID=2060617 RepID=A0A2P0VMR1_9VIRU|nr:hypothetical protein QJ968_gp079 [Tetraselmis virus 1]AUF82171.1 hypothetical protein TetV_079 [Tetraselmis virus 1]